MKHLVMPDGFRIQIDPIMTLTQYLASGANHYYSYKHYLLICPTMMQLMEEKEMLKKSSGIKPKPVTMQEFDNFLTRATESISIKMEKERRKKMEKKKE